jgi:hypothetical protein
MKRFFAAFLLFLGCSSPNWECSDKAAEIVGCSKWTKLPGYAEDVTIESDGSVTVTSGPVALTPCRRKIEDVCSVFAGY